MFGILTLPPAATLLLAAVLCSGAAPAARLPASHVVVTADGREIPSRTKPVIAFGEVSYTDADGKAQKLKASQVNIDATRLHAANKGVVTRPGALNFIDLGPSPATMPVLRPASKPRQAPRTARKQTPAAVEYIETNKSVTMYSTTWCPQCKRAKSWLNARGVSYQTVEIDLMSEADQARANAEVQRMTGRVGYPTILIGKSIVVGYDPARMTTLLTSR